MLFFTSSRLLFFRLATLLVFLSTALPVTAQRTDALAFDGIDDYVQLSPELARAISNKRQMTLEIRLTFNALESYRGIFAFRKYRGFYNSHIFELQTSGGGGRNFATNVSAGHEDFRIAGGTTIQIGREYLVTVVFDGTRANPVDRTKMYIDGILQKLSGGQHAPTATPDLGIDTPIYLAREGRNYSAITVRELRIWNTARSAAEVAAHHSTVMTGKLPAGMIARYDFIRDQYSKESPRVLAERSFAGYNGRLNNFALSGPSSNWVQTPASQAAVLPVELTRFSVSAPSIHRNDLHWEVASEVGFSHYSVERSVGEVPDWQEIGVVYAATTDGGAAQQYTYRDPTPPVKAYYRLRMVDLDGTYVYSDVVVQDRKVPVVISVYPNPSNGPVTVELPDGEPASLYLTDLSGRTVWQRELPAGAGRHTNITDRLTPGTYLLTVRSHDGVWNQRLVIR